MKIQVKIDDQKFRKELNKLSSKIKNPTTALYELGENLLREPDTPVKAPILAQNRADNKSTKTLKRNLILKNSFNYRLVGKASL